MTIIEIAVLDNGAHRNQSFHGTCPDGWAVIPDNMVCENFPFGEVEAKKVGGVMTVTKWTPGELPQEDPVEPVVAEPTTKEILNAMLGVSE